jgi:hypothetical protein
VAGRAKVAPRKSLRVVPVCMIAAIIYLLSGYFTH